MDNRITKTILIILGLLLVLGLMVVFNDLISVMINNLIKIIYKFIFVGIFFFVIGLILHVIALFNEKWAKNILFLVFILIILANVFAGFLLIYGVIFK